MVAPAGRLALTDKGREWCSSRGRSTRAVSPTSRSRSTSARSPLESPCKRIRDSSSASAGSCGRRLGSRWRGPPSGTWRLGPQEGDPRQGGLGSRGQRQGRQLPQLRLPRRSDGADGLSAENVVGREPSRPQLRGTATQVRIDPPPLRPRESAAPRPPGPVKLFYSYSPEDEPHRQALEKHLAGMRRRRLIVEWHHRKVGAGQDWKKEVDENLVTARVILLLVSADFLASDYCWNVEVARAIARHEAGEALVVPVLLRACDWKSAPFASLQPLPEDRRPVTSWPNQDEAWESIAVGSVMPSTRSSVRSTARRKPSLPPRGRPHPWHQATRRTPPRRRYRSPATRMPESAR